MKHLQPSTEILQAKRLANSRGSKFGIGLLALFLFLFTFPALGQNPILQKVKNITSNYSVPSPGYSSSSTPYPYYIYSGSFFSPIVYKGRMYFATMDSINPSRFRVWTSDGTPQGTYPITQGYMNTEWAIHSFTIYNDELYFIQGYLMKLDTTQTPPMVINTNVPNVGRPMIVYNNLLYFKNYNGYCISKTDGTPGGTLALNCPSGAYGGWHFFEYNNELWTTGGGPIPTPIKTSGTLVEEVPFCTISSSPLIYNNNLVFSGRYKDSVTNTWSSYRHLIISDGTWQGTQPIALTYIYSSQYNDTVPVPYVSYHEFVEYNGKVYFPGEDANGIELWTTDGTKAGTSIIKNIRSYGNSCPTNFKVFQNKLFFAARDSFLSHNFYVTDGTLQGTYKLKNITPLIMHDYYNYLERTEYMKVYKNKLYFTVVNDSAYKKLEMWVTDGTSQGTHKVMTLGPIASAAFTSWSGCGTYSDSAPFGNYFVYNDKLYFTVWEDSTQGFALWSLTDTTTIPTEISQTKNTDISLSPNPATKTLKINLPASQTASLQIKNLLGEVLLTEKKYLANQLLDISKLPAGAYILTLTLDTGEVRHKKFIKQ